MSAAAEKLVARGLLALAALVVVLDWVLPSSITLFFDELILFGIIGAMRAITRRR
jgi:uncharacterized membrane protein